MIRERSARETGDLVLKLNPDLGRFPWVTCTMRHRKLGTPIVLGIGARKSSAIVAARDAETRALKTKIAQLVRKTSVVFRRNKAIRRSLLQKYR